MLNSRGIKKQMLFSPEVFIYSISVVMVEEKLGWEGRFWWLLEQQASLLGSSQAASYLLFL